jgi:hypothetical protein
VTSGADTAVADGEPTAGSAATTVTAYPDGPLIIRGDFVVCDLDGAPIPTGRTAALCRCGRSALKPLCDGTHKKALRRTKPRP